MTELHEDERELITIARITRTQGRKGEVAAQLLTDFPERFSELQEVMLGWPDGRTSPATLTASWLHKGQVVLKFDGVDSISAAESLIGSSVLIPETELVDLPEDTFFDFELEGCEVVDTAGQVLGFVREILRTGGTELLVVEAESGKEHLIPFADSICAEVDVEAGRIVINPPEGLLEL